MFDLFSHADAYLSDIQAKNIGFPECINLVLGGGCFGLRGCGYSRRIVPRLIHGRISFHADVVSARIAATIMRYAPRLRGFQCARRYLGFGHSRSLERGKKKMVLKR